MIVVETPTLFHPQCLVTKRGDAEHGPYVDLLRDFDVDHQGRMYVSERAVEQMASALGHPTLSEAQELRTKVEELETRLAEAEAELSTAQTTIDAVHVLEHSGYKRREPRKPRKETHAQV